MKYDCDVIRDLIPLCLDRVSSESSRSAVNEHIAECQFCRAVFIKGQQNRPTRLIQYDAQLIKKLRKHRCIQMLTPILVSFLLCLVLAFLARRGFTIGFHFP